jgi:hypothetical protein
MHAEFWSENLKGYNHLEDPSLDARMFLMAGLERMSMWIGLIWLRIGISGGLL